MPAKKKHHKTKSTKHTASKKKLVAKTRREYVAAKRTYKKLGTKLGRLTGRR